MRDDEEETIGVRLMTGPGRERDQRREWENGKRERREETKRKQ